MNADRSISVMDSDVSLIFRLNWRSLWQCLPDVVAIGYVDPVYSGALWAPVVVGIVHCELAGTYIYIFIFL